MMGPGKYDDVATEIRERFGAHGIVLLVFEGERGNGASMQITREVRAMMPKVLRTIADGMDAEDEDLKGN